MRLRIAFVLLTALQPNGMPCIKAVWRSIHGLPPRRPFAGVMIVWRRVESQTGNYGERVTLARVDRDPLSRAALAVAAKLG